MKNPFIKKAKSEYDIYDDQYDADFMRGEEDDDGIVDESEVEEQAVAPARNKVAAAANNMLKVYKPYDFSEAPDIADLLVDGFTVVMNIEALEHNATLRLIDFLLGTLHVLGGELRRVTKTTLLLCPRPGEIAVDELNEDEGEIVEEA